MVSFILILAIAILGSSTRLGPNRLYHWQTKWAANSIELSQNNAAIDDITVQFYISPSTTISSGWIYIDFPIGFDVSEAQCDQTLHAACTCTIAGQTVILAGISLTQGVDTKIGVTNVDNPAQPGGYGPFGITTRAFQLGQIMDINKVFGNVGIAPTVNTLSNLTLDFSLNIDRSVGATGNSLSFKFQLNQDLWKHDNFKIQVDNYWKVETGTTCSSNKYQGRWNHVNGTRTDDTHFLDCIATEKTTSTTSQVLYIYGLGNDLDISLHDDYKYIDLGITSVSNPDADYTASTFLWTVSTVRFGTFTVIESSTVTGPDVDPATIVEGSYETSWGMPKTHIVNPMTVFMDVGITTINKIPFNGEMIIVVAQDVDNTWGTAPYQNKCFIIEYIVGTSNGSTNIATCTTNPAGTTSKTIKISNMPEVPGGKTILVRVLASFTGAGSITSATSYQTSGGNRIDTTSGSLASFNIAEDSGVALTSASIFLANESSNDSTNNNLTGGGESTLYFKHIYQPAVALDANTNVKIYCPLSTATVNDFQFYFPTNVACQYKKGDTDLTTGADTCGATNKLAVPIFQVSSSDPDYGYLSYDLDTNNVLATAETYYHGLNASTTQYLGWPKVETNIATKYECWFEITNSQVNGHGPQRAAIQIQVEARAWKPTTLIRTTVCQDSIDGQVLHSTFQTNIVDIPADEVEKKYYIDIDFKSTEATAEQNVQDKLGSGLTKGDAYPVICENGISASSTTYTLIDEASVEGVRVETFSGYTASSILAADCYFPIGAAASVASDDKFQGNIRGYWEWNSDPRYKNIYYEEAVAEEYPHKALTTGNTWTSATVGAGGSTVNGDETNELLYILEAQNTVNEDFWVQAVLPQGYQFAAQADLSAKTSTEYDGYSNVKTFSSSNRAFKFPTIIGQIPSTGGTNLEIPNSPAKTIRLQNVIFDTGAPSAGEASYINSGQQNAACANHSSVTLSPTKGPITVDFVTPQTINKRGPLGVDVDMKVHFKMKHSVPSTGTIKLAFSTDWATTSVSYCVATGLTPITSVTAVTCTIAANECTLTNFVGFDPVDLTLGISIDIYRLLPPTLTSVDSELRNFISTLITTDGTDTIDEWSQSTEDDITIMETEESGVSTFSSIRSYPQIENFSDVDLYLNFTLPHTIPDNGKIIIASPLSWKLNAGNNFERCWMSLMYKSCDLNNQFLEVVLGEDYEGISVLEIYLDAAVDNPSTTTTTTDGFTVQSIWGNQIIDDDPVEIRDDQKFTAKPSITGSITAATTDQLLIDPSNAGEPSEYTFTFQSSLAIETDDYIQITFPTQMDPFIGNAGEWFETEPDVFYIECESEQLGQVWCTVDHWVMTIRGDSAIAENDNVSIKVRYINNPPEASTDDVTIAHLDKDGEYKAISLAFGSITTTSPAQNLVVRSVAYTGDELFSPFVDYTFKFYLAYEMTTNSEIKALFPPQYDLWLVDGKEAYSCSTTYLVEPDISLTDATVTLEQQWNQDTSCTASGNWITLDAVPDVDSQITFSYDNLLTWTIQGVGNPQWAEARVAERYWDFDATDKDVWPLYNYWVNKYSLFVYNNASTSRLYDRRSYNNLNAAYVGFDYAYRTLHVNNYDPQNMSNRIIVYAGTQTEDIPITTDSSSSVAAKKLVLTPTTNERTPDSAKLVYTSVMHSFEFFQEMLDIHFRVAASIDLAKGLYYIDWEVEETKQDGTNRDHYHVPVKTLIEVVPKTAKKYKFKLDQLAQSIPRGSNSPPIRISIDNAPANEVVVNLSPTAGSAAGISVRPSTVTFTKDVNERYFEVVIEGGFDLTSTTTQSVTFLLSGEDSEVYDIDSPYSFTIADNEAQFTPGQINNWNIDICTRTECIFSPSVSQIGVLYWQLRPKGGEILSFSRLKAITTNLIDNSDVDALNQQRENEHSANEYDPQDGETWVDFQTRIYKEHLQNQWFGSISFSSLTNVKSITANWLMASTNYQLCGYLENVYGNASELGCGYLTTSPLDHCQPFVLSFSDNVSGSQENTIRETVSYWQGVNPARNRYDGINTLNARRLQDQTVLSTEFRYTMYADRREPSPNTSELAQVSGEDLEGLRADLENILPNSLNSIENENVPTRIIPAWSVTPRIHTTQYTSAKLSLLSNTEGSTCCIAVLGSLGSLPSTEQVYLGLGPDNTDVPSRCQETDLANAENIIEITGLTDNTEYTIYCVATDKYPLWPTRTIYTDGAPIVGHVLITKSQEDDDDDGDFSYILYTLIFLQFL